MELELRLPGLGPRPVDHLPKPLDLLPLVLPGEQERAGLLAVVEPEHQLGAVPRARYVVRPAGQGQRSRVGLANRDHDALAEQVEVGLLPRELRAAHVGAATNATTASSG